MTTRPQLPRQGGERRVAILVESPLSERDAARFGAEALQRAGFSVEYWELAPLTLPRAEQQWADRARDVRIHRMESLDALTDACRSLSSRDVVISILGVARGEAERCREVLAIVSNAPSTFCGVIGRAPWDESYPDIQSRPYQDEWGALEFALLRIRYSLAHAVAKALSFVKNGPFVLPRRRRRMGIRPLDDVFLAASSCAVDPLLTDSSTRTHVVHSFDYDLIRGIAATPYEECDSIAFIDGLGPLHPDFATLALELPQSTPELYFARMRCAFDWIEEATGMAVTIAAHPRARPGILEEAYGNRRVVYGGTAQVVATSRCVLLNHPSDAVTVVVGLRRPALVLESSADFRYQRDLKAALSRQLGWRRLEVESLPTSITLPQIDVGRYERFFRQFIRESRQDTGSFWDVVAKGLVLDA